MRIIVTGATSYFAQVLLPALCADTRVERVTGIGISVSRFHHLKFDALGVDIREPVPQALLQRHDALVYLASTRLPGRMSASDVFDVRVRSAQKLFHAARTAGIRRFIHVSSAAVYGAAVHANEQTRLNPLPGFLYAQHQAHLEQLLAIEVPECVRLRPHVIVGPHAHPGVRRLFRQPFYLRLNEPHPLFQCVHEDDLALAVALCLESGVRGAYNLAAEESFSLREALRTRHWLRTGVPPSFATTALRAAARVYGWSADDGVLPALSHPLLINCRRAIVDLGWRSHYTAQAALATT